MSANNSMDAGTLDATDMINSHGALATHSDTNSDPQSSMDTGSLSSRSASAVCQVAGCGTDLTGLKEYHQRYKICAHHFKVVHCCLSIFCTVHIT